MKTLKKRSTAAAVAVIVILFGTLFGVHRSIAAQTRHIEAMFFDGVYIEEDDYWQPSIDSQLQKRLDASLGLVTIGNQFDDLSDLTNDLRQRRLELLDAGNLTFGAKYTLNGLLGVSYNNVYEALISRELTDSEQSAVDSYTTMMTGAQGVVEAAAAAYNDKVTAFRQDLNTFPVAVLKNLAFAKPPEYFGPED